MCYELYREVRDFAPADWTPAEMVVALMIADHARRDSRISTIGTELLCYRTRLSQRGVRNALARLAERGYEFRRSHGTGSDGRPVFAARNHPPDYQVPLISEIRLAQMGVDEAVDNHPEGGTDRYPSRE